MSPKFTYNSDGERIVYGLRTTREIVPYITRDLWVVSFPYFDNFEEALAARKALKS